MNEYEVGRAIEVLERELLWEKEVCSDETSMSDEFVIKELENAIELLKNPPMWTDEDMRTALKCYGTDNTDEEIEYTLENYRKQKEEKK